MLIVKPMPDQSRARLSDVIRNLLYPAIPVIVVAAIWAVGWARALDSQIVGANERRASLPIKIQQAITKAESVDNSPHPEMTSAADTDPISPD